MPPRRKAPAAKAKAFKAVPPPASLRDTMPPAPQQQGEPSPVAALFNRAQEAGTAAAAKRLADLLWSAWARQAHESNGEDTFWLELERCVSHLLVNVPQVREREREREIGGWRGRVDCFFFFVGGGVVGVEFARRLLFSWTRVTPSLVRFSSYSFSR